MGVLRVALRCFEVLEDPVSMHLEDEEEQRLGRGGFRVFSRVGLVWF